MFDRTDVKKVRVEFKQNSLFGIRDSLEKIPFIITLNEARKYGAINVNLGYYTEPIILQVIKDNNVFDEIKIESPTEELLLTELEPGQYTFIVVKDENSNGKWDVGNLSKRKQPETLDVYSTPTKVRANWEVEIELIPTE